VGPLTAIALAFGALGFTPPEAAAPGAGESAPVRATPTIVLLMPDGAEPLLRAVQTELNDLAVRVDTLPAPAHEGLIERLARARAAAHERPGTIAVYWFDVQADHALLHVVDASGERMLVRRIGSADEMARIEALAVVVRGTASALLEGRTIGMERVDVAPPRGTDSERAPGLEGGVLGPDDVTAPRAGRVRLRAGYVGDTFVTQDPWDSGIELELGWRFGLGVHAALGYTAIVDAYESEPARSPAPVTAVAVSITRHPIHAAVGWDRTFGRWFGLDAQLRLVVDPLRLSVRSFTADGADDPGLTLATPTPPVQVGLSPRLAATIQIVPRLRVYLGGGAAFLLAGADVVVRFSDDDGDPGSAVPLATMRRVRPVVVAGLTLHL
jgi:hypothetical protein